MVFQDYRYLQSIDFTKSQADPEIFLIPLIRISTIELLFCHSNLIVWGGFLDAFKLMCEHAW
jgi:hypothetical protein